MAKAELIEELKNKSITVRILKAFTPHSEFGIGKDVDSPFG
jgi:hypothetical protein